MEYMNKAPTNWKIGLNVNESSSGVEPVVLLYLPVENNEERVIELTIEKFHLLRQQTALLLKNLLEVKEKIEA